MTVVQVPLTKGKVALIDDSDLGVVGQFSWSANERRGLWYARRGHRSSGRLVFQGLHNLITGQSPVDHINGNGLDNRRANLRACTNQQNSRNMRAVAGTSKFKGIHWSTRRHRWIALISESGRQRYLGQFGDEVAAAQAYDEAARDLFGEFGTFNFPLLLERPALRGAVLAPSDLT